MGSKKNFLKFLIENKESRKCVVKRKTEVLNIFCETSWQRFDFSKKAFSILCKIKKEQTFLDGLPSFEKQ